LVPPTLACALGQGLAGLQGLPVFDGGAAGGDGGGNVNLNAASFPANLLPHHATAAELSQMGFVSQEQRLMLQQQQQQLQLQQQQQQMQPLQQQLLHDKVKVKSKYLLDATSVSDPDPDWIRIESGQWIRIQIRNPVPYQMNMDPKHWTQPV
jgi:hypothetical protein